MAARRDRHDVARRGGRDGASGRRAGATGAPRRASCPIRRQAWTWQRPQGTVFRSRAAPGASHGRPREVRSEITSDAIPVAGRAADPLADDLYRRLRRIPDPATAALGGCGPAAVEARTRETVRYRLGDPANPLSRE